MPPADVRVTQAAALSVMRRYVLLVYASVDSQNEASVALGRALLAPLLDLAAQPRAKPAKKAVKAVTPVPSAPATHGAQPAANDVAPALRPTGTG